MSPLLNYSTTVSADKTVAEMQRLLAKAGAKQVMAEYDDGRPTGLTFTIETPRGLAAFTLPVRTERVLAVISRHGSVIPGRYQTHAQAERIAWRIGKDWLEAQLAIVETEMVTLDQVMLPYMRSRDGSTLYELYTSGGLPQLGGAS